jgi:LysM repeat protein
MTKRLAILCSVGVLLTSWGLVGCTRAKPEAATPTVVAGAGTALPTATALPTSTGTRVITPEPPPTSIPLTPGLTTVSVAELTPTFGPATTPALTTPTPLPPSGHFEYTVQWGDTLFSLAVRYNTTVEAIAALNGIQDPASIQVGQVLRIAGTPGSAPGSGGEYVVQAGDTLFSIAQRHNTTVEAIQRANGIVNAWLIQVGQKLVIPQGSLAPSSATGSNYVVQPGDTLYSIAASFGKNVWDLVVANNLSDPYWIYVGQVLTIPS